MRDFNDYLLGILGFVFGFAFFGTACVNMGFRGTMVVLALIVIGVVVGIVEDKVKIYKEKKRERTDKVS